MSKPISICGNPSGADRHHHAAPLAQGHGALDCRRVRLCHRNALWLAKRRVTRRGGANLHALPDPAFEKRRLS